MLKEFKAFLMRGNVLDLAVALIVGAAFGKIVSSLVDDILMPPIGMLLGGVDFSNLFISLNGEAYASLVEAQAAGAPLIRYGLFLNNIVQFLIISFAVFLLLKQVSRLLPKAEDAITIKACPFCVSTIPLAATRCPHCTAELAS